MQRALAWEVDKPDSDAGTLPLNMVALGQDTKTPKSLEKMHMYMCIIWT